MNTALPLRLVTRGLSKRYGAVQALDEVDFELRAGEVMALLGENGAGKSTMVKMLSGLVVPDSGTVEIDGVPSPLTSPTASQRAGISVVQQEYSTVGTLSVAENLLLGQHGSRRWWGSKYLGRQADELLHRVGLEHLDKRCLVEDLSVAEMQLLEVARVLARDAKIVVFDEPTAALSDAEIVRVLDVVRRLAAEGRSVIYVTHRLNEVFAVADRVTIFRNGKSRAPVSASGLNVDQVIAMMLGRELGDMFPARQFQEGEGEVVIDVRGLVVAGLASPVTMTARAGQIVGITGQLGSGASAVLEALAGVRPTLEGEIWLGTEKLSASSRRRGISQGVAYCSPDRKKEGIFAGVSILRNLSSPWLDRVSKAGIISPKLEREMSLQLASEFQIDQRRLKDEISTLSGGNQQKVVLGRWLGINPRLLLIDEPTRGVDVGARAEIYRQLRQLCNEGLAVIVCSSDTNEVYGLCDVIGTFHRGRLSSFRPQAEWTEPSLVREVMHSEAAAA